MRILMVSPYPPHRDGIASYAVQEVQALLAAGHDVEVLSPQPSAAHHHLALKGWRGPLALAKRVRSYDRVVVQFHPDVFYPVPAPDWLRTMVTIGLMATFAAARDIDVRVHEVDYRWGEGDDVHARLFRQLWRMADRISVHTEVEQRLFAEAMRLSPDEITVTAHGAHFLRHATSDRQVARAELGLPADTFNFLAIGFLQPHKGFDRAVRAFAHLDAGDGVRLDVVGSVRVEEPAYVEHARGLAALVASTPNAYLHDEFVSDEHFDLWLAASDVVVLPYRHIWSSGVLERAALFDRPVIATRVGGLDSQTAHPATLVDDDLDLVDAMRQAAGLPDRAVEQRPPWPVDDGRVDHDVLRDEIRRRAAMDRVGGAGAGGAGDPDLVDDGRGAVAPLVLPPPEAADPVARLVKRMVRRLTAWELEPLVQRINEQGPAVRPPGQAGTGRRPPG